jgi:branched-chain amino acid transport system substrate-binding protein
MTDFRQAVGSTAEGVLEVDGPSTDVRDKLDRRQRALVDEFLKRFKALTGTDQPPSPATNGFFSTSLLLTQVLPKAGSMDPDKIRNAYLSLDIPVGETPMGFGVKFGQDGQNQRTFMIVRQWQGEKFVAVAPPKWATAKMCCVPLKPWNQR